MMDDLYSVPAQKIAETRNNLLGVRESLSTPEDRAEGVEKLQREAGSSYAEQRYPLALRTQLTALWLLAPGKPSLPRSLAEPATPGLAALQFVIGIGEVGAAAESPGAVRPGLAGPPSPRELRIALLLDLADTALRLEDWPTARLACETVLNSAPASVPSPSPSPGPSPGPGPSPCHVPPPAVAPAASSAASHRGCNPMYPRYDPM